MKDLEARIGAAVEREGKTVDAFMVEAIARAVERSESGDEFPRNAEERLVNLQETGRSVGFDEARAYLEARPSAAWWRCPSMVWHVAIR